MAARHAGQGAVAGLRPAGTGRAAGSVATPGRLPPSGLELLGREPEALPEGDGQMGVPECTEVLRELPVRSVAIPSAVASLGARSAPECEASATDSTIPNG